MTRIDAEVLCPLCNGEGKQKTFKRMFQISFDLDLTKPFTFTSQNVCAFCKKTLPVKVKIEVEGKPCCTKTAVRNHYDLIPLRHKGKRLIHRTCASCGKEVLLRESVIVEGEK